MSRLDFVAIAEAEIGVKEVTPNSSPRILEYRDATSLGRKGVPDASWFWCSAFVCWVMQQYLAKHGNVRGLSRMRSARADDWERWGGPGIKKLDPKTNVARAGDVVTFEFDGDATAEHVGIVAADQIKLTDPIITIEGNTRPGATARDGGGRTDGVYRMTRKVSLCRAYVRWLP